MGYVSKIKVPSGTSYDIKDSNALPKSGGTMTGTLTLAADPTENYQAATKHYVDTQISNIPEPMIFKGTLGAAADNPTITSLPTAATTNKGYTYKVITAGTYASQAAKVGDVFVSDGSSWVLIPAGDDVEDTWRNIKVNGTEKLGTGISSGGVDFVNGSNTTVSFNSTGNKITVNSNGAGSSNSTSKLYLVGATAQGDNQITYSNSDIFMTNGVLTVPEIRRTYTDSNDNFFDTDILLNPQTKNLTLLTTKMGDTTKSGMITIEDTQVEIKSLNVGDPETEANLKVKSDGSIEINCLDTTYDIKYDGIYKGNTRINEPTIATSTATNQLTLASNSKYSLTIGDRSFVFTTPTDSDTLNTAGSTDTSSKIYLVGATSQAANPQTYSDDEVYVTSGVLTTKSVQVGGGSATLQYNSTTQSIDFIFA